MLVFTFFQIYQKRRGCSSIFFGFSIFPQRSAEKLRFLFSKKSVFILVHPWLMCFLALVRVIVFQRFEGNNKATQLGQTNDVDDSRFLAKEKPPFHGRQKQSSVTALGPYPEEHAFLFRHLPSRGNCLTGFSPGNQKS
jgi:hypothetical protein